MYGDEKNYLWCQQCGEPLKELTPAEVQQVSWNPYNYVLYCNACKEDFEHVQ